MLAKKLVAVLALSIAAAPFYGCAASSGPDGDDLEVEGAGQTSDELRSAVSCKEHTDTAYQDGRPYPIKVVLIGGKPVAKATAHAFLKMQAAAQSAGVELSLTSGFRTMAEQSHLYQCFKNQSCNNGNIAALPGYSNHQNGLALDLSTSSWLTRNASRFGFARTVPKEAWHFEFHGKDPGGPCSHGSTDATATPAGDDTNETPAENQLPAAGKLAWVAPVQDSTATNGFVVKAHSTAPGIVKVVYSQGSFEFGTSTAASTDFALSYQFKYMGDKTLTVQGFDAKGVLQAVAHVDFTLVP